MLSLFRLKETCRRLREGDWSSKNDLFCLGFFLLSGWVLGGYDNQWQGYYRVVEILSIYLCWRANGANGGTDFLRRFLALYRCCVLRLLAVFFLVVALMLSAGFVRCVFSGDLSGALYGECAPRLSERIFSLLDIRSTSSMGFYSHFLSLRHFVYWGAFVSFWGTIDLSLAKLSSKKPIAALPAGSEPFSDLSE
jgi:hypothetical protein